MNAPSYSYILLILFISIVISSLVLIHVQHSESSYKFVIHWEDEKRFMFHVSELPNALASLIILFRLVNLHIKVLSA